MEGRVYDVTSYMGGHPGGEGLILNKAGQDATVEFTEAKHSYEALEKRNNLLVGSLERKNGVSMLVIAAVVAIVVLGLGWAVLGN